VAHGSIELGQTADVRFLAGGGATAAQIAAYDWSRTPLGPIGSWPQALKTTVGLVVHSGFPMFLAWGTELTSLYNDAYAPFLGRKGVALGKPFAEVWAEGWDVLGPIAERALAGEASYYEDLPVVLDVPGADGPSWFTFSYSPVPDEGGGVGGVLCTIYETTGRVRAEQALRESQDRLASALTIAQLGAFDWNIRTQELVLDARSREIFGFGPDEGRTSQEVFARIHPDDIARVRTEATRSLEALERLETEYRIVLPGGTERTIVSINHAVLAPGGKAARAIGVFGDVTARKRMEQGWKEERDRLYALFEEAPGLVAVVQGPDHVFRLANRAYRELVGDRELVGKPLREALPELEGQGVFERVERVYASGEPFIGVGVPGRVRRGAGEEPEERFFDFVYQPIRESDGSISGIFHQGFDVTERVLFLRQQKLLLDELNHRVKNNLATVQAIAQQTARHAPDLPAFRKTFESRLIALARTHDVLTAGAWESADLRALLQGELAMYGDNRTRLDGPSVALSSRQALSLGLVVHELATNAAKYGALSNPESGCVRVNWRVEAAEDGAGG
jgi:two-component sensor histidine kinase